MQDRGQTLPGARAAFSNLVGIRKVRSLLDCVGNNTAR